jgi:hypothetical protein
MATPEHFTSKNSTVIEYTLGYKKDQQNRYVETTRKTSSKTSFNSPNNSFNNNNNNKSKNNDFPIEHTNSNDPHSNWFDHNSMHNNNTDPPRIYEAPRNTEIPRSNEMPENNTRGYSPLPEQQAEPEPPTSNNNSGKRYFSPKVQNSNINTKSINSYKTVNMGKTMDGDWLKIFKGPCFDKNNCCIYSTIITLFAFLAIIALIVFCLLYFGVLFKMPTYLESCSTANPCVLYKSLTCNGTCVCEADKYWNGSICLTLVAFSGTCSATYQCETGLTCLNSICQCATTTYYSGGACVNKKTYGTSCSLCSYSSCLSCYTCSECQDYSYGYCDTTSNVCKCTTGAFYDLSTSLCLKNTTFNGVCVSSTQCDSSKGRASHLS